MLLFLIFKTVSLVPGEGCIFPDSIAWPWTSNHPVSTVIGYMQASTGSISMVLGLKPRVYCNLVKHLPTEIPTSLGLHSHIQWWLSVLSRAGAASGMALDSGDGPAHGSKSSSMRCLNCTYYTAVIPQNDSRHTAMPPSCCEPHKTNYSPEDNERFKLPQGKNKHWHLLIG